MKILTVKEYNARQEIKWKEAIKKWKPNTGGFPYIGAYLFFDKKGFKARDGFVAFDGIRAIWRPTKIGVKRVYNKCIERWVY